MQKAVVTNELLTEWNSGLINYEGKQIRKNNPTISLKGNGSFSISAKVVKDMGLDRFDYVHLSYQIKEKAIIFDFIKKEVVGKKPSNAWTLSNVGDGMNLSISARSFFFYFKLDPKKLVNKYEALCLAYGFNQNLESIDLNSCVIFLDQYEAKYKKILWGRKQ